MYKTNLTGVFLIVVLLMSIATFYLPCSEAENGKNKSTVDSWEPTPLSDPAEAYIAPDFYTRQKAQPTGDNLIPRNPPHAEYAKNERQQIEDRIASTPELKQAMEKTAANPNILMENKAIKATINEFVQSLEEVPSYHSAWGTKFNFLADIKGGFAKQYISPNLNLGSTPNEDKTLYAPTMILPQPCPLEVSTRYFYTAYNNLNYGQNVEIFDFWEWQCGSGVGWTDVGFLQTDTTYVFDVGTSRPYYFVEIQYFSGQGWNVYFWNRNQDDWELKYNQPNGYSNLLGDVRSVNGWDIFEAAQPSTGYDSSWAGVNVYNPIESASIQVYWYNEYSYQYQWNAALWNYGCTVYDSWSSTPFSLTHYHANQYDNWVVRTPKICVDALDIDYGYPVQTQVYIDGNYAGFAGQSFYITPNVEHTVAVNSYGQLAWFNAYFTQWNTGSYNTSIPVTVCGSDTDRTAYYQGQWFS